MFTVNVYIYGYLLWFYSQFYGFVSVNLNSVDVRRFRKKYWFLNLWNVCVVGRLLNLTRLLFISRSLQTSCCEIYTISIFLKIHFRTYTNILKSYVILCFIRSTQVKIFVPTSLHITWKLPHPILSEQAPHSFPSNNFYFLNKIQNNFTNKSPVDFLQIQKIGNQWQQIIETMRIYFTTKTN